MSLITSAASGSSTNPIPEGQHIGICYALIDLGKQYNEKYAKEVEQIKIGWELADETITVNNKEVHRTFWNTYTNSLGEKSALRRDLVAWRGKAFTPEELERFDLRNIIGVPCLMQIVHKKAPNGNVYANLGSIMAYPRGMERPSATLERLIYDIDTDPIEKVNDLPEWIGKIIRESSSYKEKADAALDELGAKFSELESADGDLPF